MRFHRACEGVLEDVSETGALVRVPSAQAADKRLTLHLEAHGGVLQLRVRVVRLSPHRVQLPAATMLRTEYHVAVEFSDLGGEQLVALRQLLQQPN